MYNNRDDLQLIEAAKQGDSRAFDALVLRYQNRVFKIVARFVKDPSESLDIGFQSIPPKILLFREGIGYRTLILKLSIWIDL